VKPRARGLTHVIDRGLSVAEVDNLMEVAGHCVDVVKLGWGTALVSANLKPKLERYAAREVPVVLGGTLTELAKAWSAGCASSACATSRCPTARSRSTPRSSAS